jgi:hypothetical protein
MHTACSLATCKSIDMQFISICYKEVKAEHLTVLLVWGHVHRLKFYQVCHLHTPQALFQLEAPYKA